MPSKFSRAFAAVQGKDDPLSVENARLTQELADIKAKLDDLEGVAAAAEQAEKDHDAEVSELQQKLAAAEKAKTEADQAKATAEARADAAEKSKTAAEQAAETAKSDAKEQIDAKEKSVGQRANQAALDQMASVGQPPPDSKADSSAQSHNQTKPQDPAAGGFMSEEESLRLLSRLSRAGSN